MALIHKATLAPSKLDLLASWLPTRPWFESTAGVEQLGAYRFDDPAGEVGIEAFLLRAGNGRVVHVPVTYRGVPRPELQPFLIGVTEHSVLGTRWVYDGCGDPVWLSALATAVLTGGTQAEELVENDGHLEARRPTATVAGSGTPGTAVPKVERSSCEDEGATTIVMTSAMELVVVRVVGTELQAEDTLVGRWNGGGPSMLAGVRQR